MLRRILSRCADCLRLTLRLARVLHLRSKGIKASLNSNISWFSEIDRMGGEINIGDRTIIDRGTILRAYGGSIIIGADCSINPLCVLYGHGGLIIGNGVRIATQSVLIPSNHIFSNQDIYIFKQGESMRGISIEDDVWIGAGAKILDGVIIGKGCIIAAGSVVNKELMPYGVYAGIPAKKIKQRGE